METATTTFVPKNKYNTLVLAGVTELLDTCAKLRNGRVLDLTSVGHDDWLMTTLTGLTYHLTSRLLTYSKYATNPATKPSSMTAYMAAYQAESVSGDAGVIAFYTSLLVLKASLTRMAYADSFKLNELDEIRETISSFHEVVKSVLEASSAPIESSELYDVCTKSESLSENPDLGIALWEAINLAGLDGKISIEVPTSNKRVNTPTYVVESRSGYHFGLSPFEWMLPQPYRVWDYSSVRVLLVDGVVEEVSELDHLLMAANETKQPFVIIATGFSEEVCATCKSNNDNGAFNVLPLRVKIDLDSVNMIHDISTVANTVPVTSYLGHQISLTKWEALPVIERMKITPTETVIQNSKAPGVPDLIKDLIEKRYSEHTVDDVRDLIDKRLKSLVSQSVVLHLPSLGDTQTESARVAADSVLRLCKAMVTYGTVDTHAALGEISEQVASNSNMCHRDMVYAITQTINELRDILPVKVPTMSLAVGMFLGIQNAYQLLSANGAVLPDDINPL